MAAFPEYRRDFNPPRGWDRSYLEYRNFLGILHFEFRKAFDAGDEPKLARLFAFAEWCLMQGRRAKDLHETVCESFYRHVFDVKRRDWPDVARWLSPEVIRANRLSWERGMNEEDRERLGKILVAPNPSRRVSSSGGEDAP